MIVDNNFYTDLSNILTTINNDKTHKYLYGIKSQGNSPLDQVVPLYTDFFGPKVMSIVIVSKNYGYTSGVLNWPDATINQQIDTIKKSFSNWVRYKVLFYTDYVLANRIIAATSTSQYKTQMDTVDGKVQEICMQMGDFGFEYKGKLTEGKDANFFQSLIDSFYKDE